ncbi:MAG: DUF559 domain-containing protein, partial [Candidatus Gracilibacteria bacterium]|nr:DUF559 domain-containing protein [Candidatus Gracilibacteria bacterium]
EYNGQDRFIIPDFYCHEMKIILEIEGSVHNLKEIYLLDKYKKELLNNKGYKVIRIKNEDIKNNINDVLKTIKLHLGNFSLFKREYPQGEGLEKFSTKI